MSIPFFYEPVRFTGRDAEGKQAVSYMVDGGMLSNFPVDVFDRTDGKAPRWPTFGIKLSARPGRGAAPEVRRARDVQPGPGHGRDDDELPRPDPHRRALDARPDDVRRHDGRAGHRLRDRRGDAGHAVRQRQAGGDRVPAWMGLRSLPRRVPQRRGRRPPGACGGRERLATRGATGVASGPGPWDLEDFDLDAYEAPPPELEDEEPAETKG